MKQLYKKRIVRRATTVWLLFLLPFGLFSQLTLSIDTISSHTICEGETITLAVDTTFGTSPYSYLWSNSETTNSITVSPQSNILFSVTVIDSGTTPISNSDTIEIFVAPKPGLFQQSNIVICSGDYINVSNFVSVPQADSILWFNDNTSIGLPPNGFGNISGWITQSFSQSNSISATITVISYLAGCTDTMEFAITIKPTPELTQIPDQTFCPGDVVDLPDFETQPLGATINWINTNIQNGIPSSGSGQIPNYIAPNNNTGSPYYSLISVIPELNGCTGTSMQFNLSILPSPDATLDCANVDTSSVNGQVYFRVCSSNSYYNFLFTNQSTTVSSNTDYSVNWGDGTMNYYDTIFENTPGVGHQYSVGIYELTYITTNNYGCLDSSIYNVYVGSNPAVNLGYTGSTDICTQGTIEFNIYGVQNNTSETTYTVTYSDGSSSSVFSHPPPNSFLHLFNSNSCGETASNGSNTYENSFGAYIEAVNYCPTTSSAAVLPIRVSDRPVADFEIFPKDTICQYSNLTLLNTSLDIVEINFYGECDTTSDIAWSVVPNYGWTVEYGTLGNTYNNFDPAWWSLGTDSIELNFTVSGEYDISIFVGGTCGIDTMIKTILVSPTPEIPDSLLSDIEVCSGDTIIVPEFISDPQYFLGDSTVFTWTNNNTTIGLGASGTGNIPPWIATTNTSDTVNYGMITVTASLNGCIDIDSFLVSINPTPLVDSVTDIIVCPGELINIAAFTSTPPGATFEWTNSNTDIGLAASGTGNIPNWTAPLNPTFAPIVGVICVTPTLNGCTGPDSCFTVTILPTPEVTQLPDTMFCPQMLASIPAFTSTPSGASFTWSNTNIAIGLPASGIGNIPSWTTPINYTGVNITGTICVIPTMNGCDGPAMCFDITIKPTPVIDPLPDVVVCPNEQISIPGFTSVPPATSFTWTNSNTAIGLASSGIGNIPDWTSPSNNTGFDIIGTIIVTSELDGCNGTDTFTVTIQPTPIMDLISDISVCPEFTINIPAFTSTPTGSTDYTWTNTNPAIGLPASGTGTIPSWTAPPNNTGVPIVGTICVTPTLNECDGLPMCFDITIKPTPVVTPTADVEVCPYTVINIPGFTSNPSGATFTWTNSNTAIGLPPSGSGNIPGWTAPANITGSPITGNICVIPLLNGCDGPEMCFTVVINPNASVLAISDVIVCHNELISISDFASSPSGASFSWTSSNTTIGLASSGTGNIPDWIAPLNNTGSPIVSNICVTPILNGCDGTETCFTVTILPTPEATQFPDTMYCPGELIDLPAFTSLPPGSTYQWTNTNTAIGLALSGTGNLPVWTAPENNTGVPIVGTVCVIPTLDGCDGLPMCFDITIKPTPVIDPLPDVVVCPNELISIAVFTSVPPATVFTWTNSNPGIGLATSGTGNIPDWTSPANNTGFDIVGTVIVTSELDGCNGTDTFTVTILPTPIMDSIVDIEVCPTDQISIPGFTTTPPGATFAWTNSNTGIGIAASGVGTIPDWTAPTNNTGVAITGTVCVIPTLDGCEGPQVCFDVTILPTPVITQIPDTAFCPGDFISLPAFETNPPGATFTWTNSNTAIGLAASGTGNLPDWTAPENNTGADIVGLITVTSNSTLGNCPGAMSFTVTIKPTPVISPTQDIIICPDELISIPGFTSNPTGATFTWTNSNTVIGLPPSGNGNIQDWTSPPNSTGSDIVGTIIVTSELDGCNGADTFTVTFLPTPEATQFPDTMYCPGELIDLPAFTSLPPGSTYQWTNTNTAIGLAASGTGNLPVWTAPENNTGTYITGVVCVTPTLDGCDGLPMCFDITIKPTPVIAPLPDVVVCPNELISIAGFTSVPPATAFTWTNSNTGIGLPASGTGNIPDWTSPANNTGFDIVGTVIVTSELDGCNGTDTFTVTILPTPIMDSIADIEVCPTDQISIPGFTTTPPGATFAWTNSNTGIGIAASGVGTIPDWTAPTNNTGVAITGTVCVIPTLDGCEGPQVCFDVTILPTPVITQIPDTAFCPGDFISLPAFETNPPGATFTWTNSNTAIGLAASGTGNLPDWTAPENNTGADIVGLITVTSNSTLGNCPGAMSFTVTIKPTPVISPTQDIIICPDELISIPGFTSNPTGATFTWTNSNTVIGLPPSGNGNIQDWTSPPNSTGSDIVGTIIVTSELDGCNGADTFTVTILPTPEATQFPDTMYCPGELIDLPAFTSLPPGSTYQWTNTNTAIGLAASGTGNLPVWTAPENNTGTYITGAVCVTPTLDGCDGLPMCFDITIKPTPVIDPLPDVVVCPNELISIAGFTSVPPATAFTWTNSNTGIGLPASGTGNIPDWTSPANNTGFDIVGTVIVTSELDGCNGTDTFTVTILPTPIMDSIVDIEVCPTDQISIPGFTTTPPGATFAWTNSNTGIGIAASGVGTIPDWTAPTNNTGVAITGTVCVIPTLDGCEGPQVCFDVTILPTPVITQIPDTAFCPGDFISLPAFETNPPGATFTWTNSNTAIGLAASGTGNLPDWTAPENNTGADIVGLITVTSNSTLGNCPGAMSFTVTIKPTPVISPTQDIIICPDELISIPGFTSNPTGATFTWTNSNTVIGLPPSGNGNIQDWTSPPNSTGSDIVGTIIVTSELDGCNGADTFTVTFLPTPEATQFPDTMYCPGELIDLPAFTSLPPGSTYQWTNTNTAIGLAASGTGNLPVWTAPENNTGTYITGVVCVTPTLDGCDGLPMCFDITIKPTPVIAPLPDVVVCPNELISIAGFTSVPPATAFTWTNSNTGIGLPASGTGNIPDWTSPANNTGFDIVGTVIVTSELDGCNGTDTFTVTILPTPIMDSIADIEVCPTDQISIPGFTTTPPGATFAWTNSNTGIGIAASGVGTIPDWTAPTNNTGVAITGTVCVIPTLDGCEGPQVCFDVTILPTPVITQIPDTAFCPGDFISLPAFETNPPGATFTWTNSNTAIGLAASGTGNLPDWTAPENNTGADIVGLITVTSNSTLGNCPGAMSFTVTIKPTPVISPTQDIIICPDELISIPGFTSNPTGATFTWTNSNTVIGLPPSGNGNIQDWTSPPNSTGSDIVGTIIVTSELDGCNGADTFTVTILPTPEATQFPDTMYCPGELIDLPAFTSLPPGSTYQWTNTNTAIGLAASGTGNLPVWTAPENNTGTYITGAVCVTPTLDGCDGLPMCFDITIKPTPVIDPLPDVVVCPNELISIAGFTSVPPATAFTWTNSNTGIGLPASGTGNIPDWTSPANNTGFDIVGTVIVTSELDGCNGTDTFTVTILPTPIMDSIVDIEVCPTDQISIPGFTTTPPGATFAWTNSNTGIGIAASGVGTIPDWTAPTNNTGVAITGTVCVIPTLDGCEGPQVCFDVTILPTPVITQIPDTAFCPGDFISLPAFETNPPGATFTWTNSNTAIGLAASGTGNLPDWTAPENNTGADIVGLITVTSNSTLGNCPGAMSFTVTIKPTPVISPTQDIIICPDELISIPGFTSNPTGATFTWTNSNTVIGLPPSGNGNIQDWTSPPNNTGSDIVGTIIVTSELDGCNGADTFTVTILPTPEATQFPDTMYCPGELIDLPAFTSLPPGSTYQWTNTNTAIGLALSGTGNLPVWTAPENNTGTYITGAVCVIPTLDGCDGLPMCFDITIKPTPVIAPLPDVVVCPNELISIAVFTSVPPATAFTWTNSNPGIGLATSGTGNIPDWTSPANNTGFDIVGTVIVTSELDGCNGTDTFTVTILPTPIMDSIADIEVCPTDQISIPGFTTTPPGATFAWTNSNTGIGIAASGVGTIPDWTAPTNNTGVAITGTVCVIPTLDGCEGPQVCFDVTILPTPVITQIPDTAFCPGDFISLPAFETNPPGATFTWTNSNTAIGLAASGTGNLPDWTAPENNTGADIVGLITVTSNSTLGNCPGAMSFTVTIKPTPVISPTQDIIICPDELISIPGFTSNPTGATFTWTNSNTVIGLPPSGNGNIQDWTSPPNNTGSDIVGTIIVTSELDGCNGADTFTVTILPTPEATQFPDTMYCPGELIDLPAFTSLPPGSTYQWTNTNTAIGLAASGTGNLPVWTAPENNTGTYITGAVCVTPTLDGCDGLPMCFDITIKPTPVIDPLPDVVVCPNELISIAVFTSVPPATVFTWTNSNPGIGLATSGTGNIPDWTSPANNTGFDIVGTVIVTSELDGCNGTDTFTVTILPTPIMDSIADIEVCPTDQISIPGFTTTPPGATFAWTNSNTGIGIAASGVGTIPDWTAPTNNTGVAITGTVCVIPTLDGCEGPQVCFDVTILPTPVITQIPDTAFCPGDFISLPAFETNPPGATFTWTNSNTAIGLAASGTGNLPDWTAPENNTGADIVGLITVTSNSTLGNCPGAMSFTVTIKPTPVISPTQDIIICPDELISIPGFTSNPTGATFTWTNSNTVIGLPPSGNGNIQDWTSPPNNTGSDIVGTIIVTSELDGCNGADTFTVTILPTPEATQFPDTMYCPGELIDLPAFTSLPPGSTYQWTNTNTAIGLALSGTGNLPVWTAPENNTGVPIVGTVCVIPTLDGCDGLPMCFDITIKPTPVIDPLPDVVVCPNELISIAVFTSVPPATVFTWTNSNPGIGLPASGTGNIPDWTSPANNTGFDIVGTVIVTSELDGCNGTDTFTVTILPTPIMDSIADIEVCPTDQISIPGFTTTPPGATFAWTNSNTGIGIAASGVGTIPDWTAPTNNTGVAITGTVCVIPTLDGCEGPQVCFDVTILPTPVITQIPDTAFCPGDFISLPAFETNPPGATFTWTNSNTAIGLAASGTGNLPDWTAPENNTGADIVGLITVTSNSTLGNCPGAMSFTVTIKPTPVISPTQDIIICPDELISIPGFTSNPTGATFTWTNSNTVIGLPPSGNGNIQDWTSPPNSTGSDIVGTIIVTSELDGCNGADTFTVTILPTPEATQFPDTMYCPGELIDLPAFTSLPPGSTYQWTNTNTAIGLAASGTGNLPVWTAPENNTGTYITGAVCVTPTLDGCDGLPMCFDITIKPTPVIDPLPDVVVCPNELISIAVFTSVPPATVFTWTNSNPGIGLATSGTGNIPDWTSPANNTGFDIVGTVIVTSELDGCNGTDTFTVTILPTPIMDSIADIEVCPTDQISIPGFTTTPPGATFAWTNSNTGIGIAASGVGTIPDWTAPTNNTGVAITGTVCVIPTLDGCEGPQVCFDVTILPTPVITQIPDTAFCPGDFISLPAFETNPPGATFTWTNSNTAIGLAASGTGNLPDWTAPENNTGADIVGLITVTSNSTLGNCPGAMSFTVTIKPTPVISPTQDIIICPDELISIPGFTSNPTGATFTWTNSNTVIGLPPSGNGNIQDWTSPPNNTGSDIVGTIIVTSELDGCNGADTFTVTILPTPEATQFPDTMYCPGELIDLPAFTSLPPGSTYQWTNTNTAIGLALSGTGNLPVWTAPENNTGVPIVGTVCVIPTLDGCDGLPMCFDITIKPTPVIDPLPDVVVCPNELISIAVFTSVPPATVFTWTNSNPGIGLATSGTGNIPDWTSPANNTGFDIVGTVIVTSELDGCNGTDTFTVTILPTPIMDSIVDIEVCPTDQISIPGFTTTPPGATFAWTNSNTGIGIAASGVGTIPDWTAPTNNTGVAITGTIEVVSTLDGCNDTIGFSITIHPSPKITSELVREVCSGDEFYHELLSNVSQSTYIWKRDKVTGISPDNSSGTGSIINETLINEQTQPIVVKYKIVAVGPFPTYCESDTIVLTLTVLPSPMVTSSLSLNVCSEQAFSYVVDCNLPGTVYSWERLVVPGILNPPSSGYGHAGETIDETLINTTNEVIIVTYTIEPDILTGDTCPGIDAYLLVYVHPIPKITSELSTSLCSEQEFLYSIQSDVEDCSFEWIREVVPGISNPANSGTGDSISEILINETNMVVQVPYYIKPIGPEVTYCEGNTTTIIVDVHPKPIVTSILFDTICANSNYEYEIISNVGESSFTWIRPSISGVLAHSNSGSSTLITEFLEIDINDPIDISYYITPYGPVDLSCEGDEFELHLHVIQEPSVDLVAPECLKKDESIVLNAQNPGSLFLWSTGETTQTIEYSLLYPDPQSVSVSVSTKHCHDVSDKIDVEVCPLIDIPNAFSPNGDGVNDQLKMEGFGVETVDLKIYNRWGELVFRTKDHTLQTGWNGIYKGEPQEIEVYFYKLQGTFKNGHGSFSQEGNITLLR